MRCGNARARVAFVGFVACGVACGFTGEGTQPLDADAGPGADASPETQPPPPTTDAAPPPPICPEPLIELRFAEGNGLSTRNTGTTATGAQGALAVYNAFPAFTINAPSGLFAPAADKSAIDFGDVGDSDKDRAVDFSDDVARATEGLAAFTITGWLNLRSSSAGLGGNRIFTTHKEGELRGIDFVHDGAQLRLGVNDYADQGNPPKSNSKLTFDGTSGPANWIFFAVTYDSRVATDPKDGTVSFAFGTSSVLAEADLTAPYDNGPVKAPSVHALSVGNFTSQVNARHDTGGGSRIVRGLMDELRFFGRALTLDEARCVQRR